MTVHRTPGVYFEWLDNRPPPLIPLRTDIAGFIGIAERGPINQPIKIQSWDQFVTMFGAHIPQAYLAYAVEGFFANGGTTCWIVRVATNAAQSAKLMLILPGVKNKKGNRVGIEISAVSAGIWGCRIGVEVSSGLTNDRVSITIRYRGIVTESWRDIPLLLSDSSDPLAESQRLIQLINGPEVGSKLIKAQEVEFADFVTPKPEDGCPPGHITVRGSHEEGDSHTLGLDLSETSLFQKVQANLSFMANGSDDDQPVTICYGKRLLPVDTTGLDPDGLSTLGPAEYVEALSKFELVDEISMVAIPDLMVVRAPAVTFRVPSPRCHVLDDEESKPSDPFPTPIYAKPLSELEMSYLQREMIAHCTKLKDRIAILDMPPSHISTPRKMKGWRDSYDTKYGAMYTPWIGMPDPLRLNGVLRSVPPSGHIAGIYARGDLTVGVHKPPANEVIVTAQNVTVDIGEVEHGFLNENGINVIRPFGGRGVRVVGARMLQNASSEWRYINVRRLLLMIAEAIDEQLQWTVFEPNSQPLRDSVVRVVSSFLEQLWLRGMLDGATREDAYSVVCDDSTTPQVEADQGRLICEVGVLPPWPAEFVVIRIGRSDGEFEILDV